MLPINDISNCGLDTLSAHQLRSLTSAWTGDLTPVSLADSVGVEGLVGAETFATMTERWLSQRDIYHDVVADSVFGADATLAEGVQTVACCSEEAVVSAVSSAADVAAISWPDIMLNVLALVVAVLYLFCIYRYYYDVIALIQTAIQSDVKVSERVNERRRSDIFYGFLGKLFLLGIGFIALFATFLAVRHGLFDLLLPTLYLSPLAGVLLFVVLAMFQFMLLLVAGFVTQSSAMAAALTQTRLTYFVLFTIVVAPLLLIAEVAGGYGLWYIASAVVACIVLVLYLRESLGVFIKKKISILHWILYLCTVEILPLTLLWQIAERLR